MAIKSHKATKQKDGQNLQLSLELGKFGEKPNKATPTIISSRLPAKPTVVFDTYWRFAAERQNIFYKKLQNTPMPWTDDPILSVYKFTNTYRAIDTQSMTYQVKSKFC